MISPKQNLDFGLKAAGMLLICLVWFGSSSQRVVASSVENPTWNPPVVGSPLINHYRQPSSDYTAGHRGVDYEVIIGQPVFAPFDGNVWFVGRVVDRELISLHHGNELLTSFEPVCSSLNAGEAVLAGDYIGEVCLPSPNYRQHCSDFLCLHFSVRHQDQYLSPLVFIGGLNPSRLLPWIEPTLEN
jgi:murein DD-endopeptidase MepM/ murein hydrolase activator NlpD